MYYSRCLSQNIKGSYTNDRLGALTDPLFQVQNLQKHVGWQSIILTVCCTQSNYTRGSTAM